MLSSLRASAEFGSTAQVVAAPVEVVQPLTRSAADRALSETLTQPVERVIDTVIRWAIEQVELRRVGKAGHANSEQAHRIARPRCVEQ